MNSSLPILNPTKLQLITLIVAFLLVALFLIKGIFAGLALSRAKANYQNVETLAQALEYYHKDQGVYPSADQFNNQRILVPFYLAQMPGYVAQKGVCSESEGYIYTQTG